MDVGKHRVVQGRFAAKGARRIDCEDRVRSLVVVAVGF
jgi:hypothetical protein